MSDKIQASHLERRAIVYLRQSTFRQVRNNHESTVRQYALGQRALALGWPPERVEILDEDLGRSGTSTEGRMDFQRLAKEVVQGQIGAIFALEVSRLSRSSADWHRLLDLCGVADVILLDEERVYAPGEPDDRLLLGLKGTMSEAEQYWMRLRLEGGRLSKARRGELRLTQATGFAWDAENSRFRLDPDERVQQAVRLVFERFRLEGSGRGVLTYLLRQGLEMPAFDKSAGTVTWGVPRLSHILGILHNPVYAGAYVFGRRASRLELVNGDVRRRIHRLPVPTWKVCLHDRHPAYISWDEFLANQSKLRDNRTSAARGAPRNGHALLQGIALCGRCGRHMAASYGRDDTHTVYSCASLSAPQGILHRCWAVPARAIDRAVTALFLDAIHVPELEIALEVARETERQAKEVERLWALRRERLTYDARLAEKRYKSVDPENRVVVRTLERDWNEKLEQLEQLESEYQAARRAHRLDPSDDDRAEILALARDLPRVWSAPTTTHAEQKNLLRMLVNQVVLAPIEAPVRSTRIQVLWITGAVTELTAPRPNKYFPPKTATMRPEVIDRIRVLVAAGKSDSEIAEDLNQRRLRTVHDQAWTTSLAYNARMSVGLHRSAEQRGRRRCSPLQRSDGLYSLRGVAARLGVTVARVHGWVERGKLSSSDGGGAGRPQWFKLDRATMRRLMAQKARWRGRKGSQPMRGSTRRRAAS